MMAGSKRMRIGLIVNPVAGLGGRVALKGSDGVEIQHKALLLGARPEAGMRTTAALKELEHLASRIEFLTYPGEMGEDVLRAAGYEFELAGGIRGGRTDAADTREGAVRMTQMGIDLLLFAGGDGTARDIHDAIGLGQPVIGIPAGVKIHSAVFGTHPRSAGELARLFLERNDTRLQEREVMDVDEVALRSGRMSARLYGFLSVPVVHHLVQAQKAPSPVSEQTVLQAIALEVVELMESDYLYLLGPGTTTRAVAARLGLAKTLLGVDVVSQKALLAQDATEEQLLALMSGRRAHIIVAPIGGQGFLFGRGNQQISPAVLGLVDKEHIVGISTPDKIFALRGEPFLVDTGDPELDRALTGFVPVITGYRERIVYRIAC
jgi:predicted polyphosphate/ATP-dependent NAD kinase